eukprot:gene4534-4786_t
MLALWTLLNTSTNLKGQVSICKKGLYTLINLVHHSPDPQHASVAANVLRNVAVQENVRDIYKAELRLKHAALLRQAGIQQVYRERHKPRQQPQQVKQQAGSSVDLPVEQQVDSMSPYLAVHAHSKYGPEDLKAAASVSRSSCSPPLTSRLQEAADSAVLKADMSSSLCQGSIQLKADVDHAAHLLRRASMLVRDAAGCGKPHSASGSSGNPAAADRSSHLRASFSVDMHSLAERAAGLVTSRSHNPVAQNVGAAQGGTACSDSRPGQLPPGVDAHNVRTAFLDWLHNQLPDPALTGCNAAKGPPTGNRQQTEQPRPTLQRLTEAAELNKVTTEDVEEERWLAQQRQAQALHDYYEARAAQGQLLRGSLAGSLRSSMNKLWREDWRQPPSGNKASRQSRQDVIHDLAGVSHQPADMTLGSHGEGDTA